ncbi:translation initiation factor eIF-2B subunit delta isoform X2 [Lucilia cuprina]|nr:translation initiation factor eIF-2B subunit delta isoform X2 [Lucilia cuprina]
MNTGEIITTEINTEIKVEVQLETASIVKVETKAVGGIENTEVSTQKAIGMMSNKVEVEKEKTRDEIKAEREAKKLAKQAKKQKAGGVVATDVAESINNSPPANTNCKAENVSNTAGKPEDGSEKSREQIKAEREAKKLAKQAAKSAKAAGGNIAVAAVTEQLKQVKINERNGKSAGDAVNSVEGDKKKTALTKAERRAIQEAQRAAKAQAQSAAATKGKSAAVKTTPTTTAATVNKTPIKASSPSPSSETRSAKRATSSSPVKTVRFNDGNVKLFSHLEKPNTNVNLFVNNTHIHPSIARLGEQYAKRTIVGSNARCLAFLGAIKMVIEDYETPAKKEFSRSLESFIANCVEYLQKCRTLAVSVINAHKSLKQVLMQLPKDEPESELKERLFIFIDTYIENQIFKAAQAINSMMQTKINNGDVILTFGCSSLINFICEEAQARKVDFRVIVVDSRPFCEGQELLRRLTANEISCSYVLINAVSFVMPEVTKVLLGAHALLANGYVMARAGTAQVALVARSFNVPVLVCCETHKFSERFQTDAIVYNELGNPDDIVVDDKCCLSNWQAKHKMSPLNLNYDITPPELVTAVVTEVSVLPCTSVPVILRMKPDWLV